MWGGDSATVWTFVVLSTTVGACSSSPPGAPRDHDASQHAGDGADSSVRDGGAVSDDGNAQGAPDAEPGTVPDDAGEDAGPPAAEQRVSCSEQPWDPEAFVTVLHVGPGRAAETPSDVPWEALGPGTLVLIHARATPYRDKWVLNVAGTEQEPVVVRGVPDAHGALPQLRGDGAVTRPALNFWGEERSVIKVGGSNVPDNAEPSHIFVECLDIAGARPGNSYTGDDAAAHEYAENAAAITVETGSHLTFRNNVLHDNGNGLFTASASRDVRVLGNYLHGNGNVDSVYEHNSYTESDGIVFEGNHYGPLCDGCLGNNLKDRSAGTVIRYNWIEAGNRQLDLVDSGHDSLASLPSYRSTFVYGNVLIEPDGAGNSQIIHYGGDSGNTGRYRKGTLHFFHNTLVSTRSGNTTVVRLSSNDEGIDARNNIFYVTAAGSALAITDGSGNAALRNNWLPSGWRTTHGSLAGSVTDVSGNRVGSDPGFQDAASQDFTLSPTSPCRASAGPLASEASAHLPTLQIGSPTLLVPRPAHTPSDIGALEHEP